MSSSDSGKSKSFKQFKALTKKLLGVPKKEGDQNEAGYQRKGMKRGKRKGA